MWEILKPYLSPVFIPKHVKDTYLEYLLAICFQRAAVLAVRVAVTAITPCLQLWWGAICSLPHHTMKLSSHYHANHSGLKSL